MLIHPPSGLAPHVRRCAFTLLELLVVVAIIVVLISILLPSLEKAVSQAQSVRCLANTRQISIAAIMYARDYNAYVGFQPGIDRKMLLFPYLNQGTSNQDVDRETIWHCPSNTLPLAAAGYGFNTYMNFAKLTQIVQPSMTVGLTDAGINDSLQPILSTHCFPPSSTTTPSIGRPHPKRHTQGDKPTVNVGWVDGHGDAAVIEPPFYPDVAGAWTGNAIRDPQHADYKDQLWDLE